MIKWKYKGKISKAVKLLSNFVADDSRLVFTAISFRNGKASACNGFIWVNAPADKGLNSLNLPAKSIPASNEDIKVYSNGNRLYFANTKTNKRKAEKTSTITFAKAIDYPFPSEPRLPDGEIKADICIDPHLLALIIKACPKKSVLQLAIRGRTEPVEFIVQEIASQEIAPTIIFEELMRGQIMPMCVEWSNVKWGNQDNIGGVEANDS